jgi:hypothetical protein
MCRCRRFRNEERFSRLRRIQSGKIARVKLNFVYHGAHLIEGNDRENLSQYALERKFSHWNWKQCGHIEGEGKVRESVFPITYCRKLGKSWNDVWFVVFKVYNFQNTCLCCREIAPVESLYTLAHFYPTQRRHFYRRNIQGFFFCIYFH